MILNSDVYYNVIQEILRSENRDLEITIKFMFSGKQSLVMWKKFIESVDLIEYWNSKDNKDNSPVHHVAQLKWVGNIFSYFL